MELLPPVRLDQIVPFEDALNHEVVLLVALVKQALLYDCKFALHDSEKAGINCGHADLLPDLKVFVEKHFLTDSPANVYLSKGDLGRADNRV